MKLTTTRYFKATPEQLWPLLFQSKMDERRPCYFLCGLPKPIECRLEGQEGGVGHTRECVSDKGVIKQTIVEWEPNRKFSFRLRETDIYFSPYVDSIIETFELQSVGHQNTTITRQTEFQIKPILKPVLSLPMLIGLKSIHHYVFDNWKRLVEKH